MLPLRSFVSVRPLYRSKQIPPAPGQLKWSGFFQALTSGICHFLMGHLPCKSTAKRSSKKSANPCVSTYAEQPLWTGTEPDVWAPETQQ